MIQEQIQRLREAVTTCYNTVSSKNGVIPEEVEDFTVRNLPEAIESIPTSNGVLTELEVTANGVYMPEEGVDGFSKVTASFDTSSLPKPKIGKLFLNPNCINEDGIWDGKLLDVSEMTQISFEGLSTDMNNLIKVDISGWDTGKCTIFWYAFIGLRNLTEMVGHEYLNFSNAEQTAYLFSNCSSIRRLDASRWRFPKITRYGYGMFRFCTNLEYLNVEGWDTSKFTDLQEMFQGCKKITSLDLTSWSLESATNVSLLLWDLQSLETFVGGRTIDDVTSNNITALRGLKISLDIGDPNQSNIDTASLRALINGLADVTDQPAESRPTLTLGTTLMSKLETEDPDSITIATEKGWNLA